MDPVTLSILIPAVVATVSGFMQSGNNADAQKTIDDAVAKYGPEARALIEKELGGPSAMAEVYGERLAPEAAAAQRNALRQLQQVSEKGYTPEEEAAIRQIQSETAATAASQRAATQEAFARRGISGGGAERVAAFQAASQAANRAGQQGLDVAAQAQRRAFQAMQAQGNLGTSVRGQAYGEAERRAMALDEKNRLAGQRKGQIIDQAYGYTTGTEKDVNELENRKWKQLGESSTAIAGGVITAAGKKS